MARKIHTKQKRRWSNIGRKRATRPKTFKTEESANNYAKANGIDKFEFDYIRSDKIRIIQ